VDGQGYRGGASVANANLGLQGESSAGPGGRGSLPNVGGGGGGSHPDSGGGGGGYGTPGQPPTNAPNIDPVSAGATYGDAALSSLYLGSGGGSAGSQMTPVGGGAGGNGGGAISIQAQQIIVTGRISANGADGTSVGLVNNTRGGGGGSGG
jgi:hypothetical protein